jgi:CubicO group peptidase (beta-lactamase class C family)
MATVVACKINKKRAARLAALLLVTACATDENFAPNADDQPSVEAPSLAVTLSSYFPPSEAAGGWRSTTDSAAIRALGIDVTALTAFGAYNMSLPYENYSTGVSGYKASNKAALVIKNGWMVGEFYNQASARTGVYYLASNGKTFAIMLMGKLVAEHPELGITLSTPFYDARWLYQGFPLSDARKGDITFDEVFRHASGIIPEKEAAIASGAVRQEAGWDLIPFTVGKDPEWPQSGPLYFAPGNPATYRKGSTYSSVAFNHFGLIFRNVSGLAPETYLRQGILDPIKVGRMDYKYYPGQGSDRWATAGNGLASARDYARLMYLLLHEGDWAGTQIFPSSWIRQFTTVAGYPNIRSNVDCYWGTQYPKDMYHTTGSGFNQAFVIPSLDLVATHNGRTQSNLIEQATAIFLTKLFAAVKEPYVTCDGRTVSGDTASADTEEPRVIALELINADTDLPIQPMTDGMTITLASLPTRRLNVRAVTAGVVGEVKFGLDAKDNYRTETVEPYAMAADTDGDYKPWTPGLGSHTIKATPLPGSGASGPAGASMTVRFTVR